MTNKIQGRPKGAGGSYFRRIRMGDLREYITDNATIIVSKTWLENIGFEVEESTKQVLTAVDDEPKIEFNVIH